MRSSSDKKVAQYRLYKWSKRMKKNYIIMTALVVISLVGLYCHVHHEKTKDLSSEQEEMIDKKDGENKEMKIKISNGEYEIIYLLNDSQASQTLYAQLPLNIKVENYGSNEKIFYPPEALNTNQTPLLQHGGEGTLGYFAPWDDVVMFYGPCRSYSGLYVLGEAISGGTYIKNLSGNIQIEKEDDEL